MFDQIHELLLRKWLDILKDLLSGKYKKVGKFIFFSWWTSLMFKYTNFPRFSKDLDFAIDVRWKKYDKIFYNIFAELKERLEKYCEMKEIPIFSSFWNWREFVFQWERWIASIKIDFMYDWILSYENCCWIKKISDLDIFINKLQRLNKTDLEDLKFLYKKNRFSISEIVNWIRQKASNLYWNPYYLDNKILLNLKNVKWFSFLKEIWNEISRF